MGMTGQSERRTMSSIRVVVLYVGRRSQYTQLLRDIAVFRVDASGRTKEPRRRCPIVFVVPEQKTKNETGRSSLSLFLPLSWSGWARCAQTS